MVWFDTATGRVFSFSIWIVERPIIFRDSMIFLFVNINLIFNRSFLWFSGSLERHGVQCKIKTERIMFILVSFFGFWFFGSRLQGFFRLFEIIFPGANEFGRWVERRKRPLRSDLGKIGLESWVGLESRSWVGLDKTIKTWPSLDSKPKTKSRPDSKWLFSPRSWVGLDFFIKTKSRPKRILYI